MRRTLIAGQPGKGPCTPLRRKPGEGPCKPAPAAPCNSLEAKRWDCPCVSRGGGLAIVAHRGRGALCLGASHREALGRHVWRCACACRPRVPHEWLPCGGGCLCYAHSSGGHCPHSSHHHAQAQTTKGAGRERRQSRARSSGGQGGGSGGRALHAPLSLLQRCSGRARGLLIVHCALAPTHRCGQDSRRGSGSRGQPLPPLYDHG